MVRERSSETISTFYVEVVYGYLANHGSEMAV
jgi:hypothetical protein